MVEAYTYLGNEDVIVIRKGHDCFIIQRRENLIPYKEQTRDTLREAERVYAQFLDGDDISYE